MGGALLQGVLPGRRCSLGEGRSLGGGAPWRVPRASPRLPIHMKAPGMQTGLKPSISAPFQGPLSVMRLEPRGALFTHMHTHSHTLKHTHIHTHVHTCSHTHVHTQMFTHTLTLKHIYSHTHMLTHTHIQAHTHTLTHIHTYALTHIRTHTHLSTLTHAHMLTHTHSSIFTHMLTLTLAHKLTHTRSHTHSHMFTHVHTCSHSHTCSLTHAHTHNFCSRRVPISPPSTPSPLWEPGPGRRGPQCSVPSWAAAGCPACRELAISPHVCSWLPFLGSASDRRREARLKHHGESALLPLPHLPSQRGPVSVGRC